MGNLYQWLTLIAVWVTVYGAFSFLAYWALFRFSPRLKEQSPSFTAFCVLLTNFAVLTLMWTLPLVLRSGYVALKRTFLY